MSVSAALGEDYTGLVARDIPGLDDAGYTITLRFEVSRSPAHCEIVEFIGCVVAWISVVRLPGGLTIMMLSA